MKKNSSKSLIIKTSLTVVSIILSILLVLIAVFYLFFPSSLADFNKNLGFNTIASSLYKKDYDNSKNIDSLHKAVSLSIFTNNYSRVIDYYEILEDDANYSSLMARLNTNAMKLEYNNVIKSTLINNDNYLKNGYIKALINKNNSNLAFTYAYSNSNLSGDINYLSLGNYLFSNFFNGNNTSSETIELFTSSNLEHLEYGEEINNYFSSLFNEFNAEFSVVTSNNQPYIIALANRIMEVGQNLILLDNLSNRDYIDTESVRTNLMQVNTNINSLINPNS